MLGHIIKVTPTSKVVGDLAIFAVSAGIDLDELERNPARFDLPDSVLDFLRGSLGSPQRVPAAVHGACTERPPRAGAAGATAGGHARGAAGLRTPPSTRAVRDLFPGPLHDYLAAQESFGDVSLLPTAAFFYGLEEGAALPVDLATGVRVIFELEAVGEPDDSGVRTVMARVNGSFARSTCATARSRS